LGIHPNTVTITGLLFYTGVAWMIGDGHWKLAVAVGVAGALMDGLDGVMAREFGKRSRFGAVLDSTCDRLTEILVFSGLLVFYLRHDASGLIAPAACLLACTGSLMVSYVKARAEGEGLTCSRGLLQRPERLIFLGIFLFLGDTLMVWGLAVLAVLTYLTMFQRMVLIFRQAVKIRET
jgi:CDP-diacylglycerol--glycerol-3-phosphate 3-phosphatidyltransferase